MSRLAAAQAAWQEQLERHRVGSAHGLDLDAQDELDADLEAARAELEVAWLEAVAG